MHSGTLQRDLRKEPLNRRLPERIFARVHEDIAAAAMSWEHPGAAGVFNAERSSIIAFNLCHFIADELERSMHEIADLKNVPQHEVERRLRQAFAAELEGGERGLVEDLRARIKWLADNWAKVGQVFRDLEALFGDVGGPAPPVG